ncbi:MAG: hypothetical protein NZ455_05015, partial [Bacteroidia bacterium]|nr:hypothetical protein [Bacteroidia bacterium]
MHHKVLALDLGVGSIGWALVCLPHKEKTEESSLLANLENLLQSQIIGMGTRVIPLDSESEKNPFEQGKA